jgi:ABC-type sugar transport system substrate-binding protein
MMNQYGDELVAIICDNDDMSSAAQKACDENGRSDVVCVGVDGNTNPLQMVKDGEMGATVLQDGPGQVAGAIEMIKTCLAGETPEKEIAIPFVLVTIDNVDEYLK